MKALIQRVSSASVEIDGRSVGKINRGLLVFLAVEQNDTLEQVDKLVHKLVRYRVFADAGNRMNLSVSDINGGVLVVSQFTLAADTEKGLRPSFSGAAEPEKAREYYQLVVDKLAAEIDLVQTGEFAADMQVSLVNDGPVTFMLEC